ncbi:MAG: hypothetical protein V1743_05445 [Nanoarchaeota archaeon]
MKPIKCIECDVVMVPATSRYRGLDFEAWQCPKCKEKIFTEEQSRIVVKKLEQQRLEKEYIKQPMRIGRSWGMTFPKTIVDVFHLNDKKTKMKLLPDVREGRIIIEVEE